MTARQDITYDPVYYITVGFFALLTTGLPIILGQPNFLPIVQAFALTVFLAVPLSRRNPNGALRVVLIWLPLQFLLAILLTLLTPGTVERAIHDGFTYRGALSAWLFGTTTRPGSLVQAPLASLGEIVGVLVGSLATAGLIGAWFLMRLVNLAAFGTGVLVRALEDGAIWRTIPYWTLLRVAGLGGFLVLLAEPLLTYKWSPLYYWHARRRLILISAALLALGLLLELVLPSLVVYPPLP